MAKYTSDANLIKGAATAYKNWDNVAGVYAGLDKVTKAGMGMVDKAVKDFEAEKKKQEAIEKSWNDSADQVLLNAGSLGDTLYNSTSDEVKELKKLYLQGVNEKDDKKRLAAMRGLQSHSTWIQDHKQMNLDYAAAKKDGKLSSWYSSKAGSEEAHTVDQIMGQKYTKTSRGEDGDVIFHIKDSNGKEKLVPSKEYNNMILPKNYTVTANTEKLQTNMNKSRVFSDDIAMQSIKNSLPTNERDFIASMYDDVSGKNLIEMLETSKTLDQEILNAIDSKAWDLDDDPKTLNAEERKNFIDAVTDPENDFFDLETSKQIMADQIFNGVKNRHTKHWEKVDDQNKDKSKGLNLSYGFRNWGQMQSDYDLIKSGKEGDTVNAPYNGEMRTFTRKADGTFSHKHAGGEIIRTPEQMRQLKELTHLSSIEGPAGGYITPETKEEIEAAEIEAKNKIPLPNRDITSEEYLKSDEDAIEDKLKETYQAYGDFKFEYSGRDLLRMIAPDGTVGTVKLNRRGGGNNKESQNKIRDFIYENSEENNEFAE